MKKCKCCNVEKLLEEFHKKASNKDGHYSYCKQCKAIKDKQYYDNNRDELLEKVKKYAKKVRPKLAQYTKEYRLQNREKLNAAKANDRKTNPEKALYRAAKHRAKFAGIEFNLEVTDIIIPKYCPVLYIPLYLGKGSASPNSPSLDRMDSTKGYIKGNVHVISYKANTMKSNADQTDLLLFSDWVLKTFLEGI